MISLYRLLDEHRDHIIAILLNRVPREVKAYRKIPRPELRASIDHLFDAYVEFLLTGEITGLKSVFKYIARVRFTQGFSAGEIIHALLMFSSVMRCILQEEFRKHPGDGQAMFNKAMAHIERSTSDGVATFAEVFQEYVQSRVDQHNDYLNERKEKLGIDLSKFILFRA